MIERRVRAIIGADGEMNVDAAGRVEVAPRSEEECALLLGAAHSKGWSVRLCGGGSWLPLDAPAELVISTRCLVGVSDLSPADMVLTALAGTPLEHLQSVASQQGTWIALDPPGTTRSLGSILATGTSGPLRTGFGAVRNRVLGLTFVTADGRIIRVGGRVVKNVAGFNLTSLLVGSFGAFGLITSANVRLSATPAADVTLVARGTRDDLLDGSRAILSSGNTPAALELLSPDTRDRSAWALAIRSIGSEAAVAADRRSTKNAASKLEFEALDGDSGAKFWANEVAAAVEASTTVRMGCLQSELESALDMMSAELDENSGATASVSILSGVARWSCDAPKAQIQNLRVLAADRDWPLTLERAPWEVLRAVGHYGAYRKGVGRLVESLRGVFDDRGLLVAPIGHTA